MAHIDIDLHLEQLQIDILTKMMVSVEHHLTESNTLLDGTVMMPRKTARTCIVDTMIYALGRRDVEHIMSHSLIDGLHIDLNEVMLPYVQFYRGKHVSKIEDDEWDSSRAYGMIIKSFKTIRYEMSQLACCERTSCVRRDSDGLTLTLRSVNNSRVRVSNHHIDVPSLVIDRLNGLLELNDVAGLLQDQDKLHLMYAVLNRYKLYLTRTNHCLSCDDVHERYPASLEMFAHPMNSHARRFCSAFPDIEIWFGSIGSAAHVTSRELIKHDVVVANPPYIGVVMTDMAKIIARTVSECKRRGVKMKFIVTIPDWRSTDYPCWNILSPLMTHVEVHDETYEYVDKITETRIAASRLGTLILTIET